MKGSFLIFLKNFEFPPQPGVGTAALQKVCLANVAERIRPPEVYLPHYYCLSLLLKTTVENPLRLPNKRHSMRYWFHFNTW